MMNTNTFVVCADVHASDYSAFSKPIAGLPYGSRLKIILDALNDMFKEAQNEKASRAIIVGDLFNERTSINPIVTQAVINNLTTNLSSMSDGFILDIVVGNHDQQDNTLVPPNSVSIFNSIKIPNKEINVYDHVTYVDNGNSGLVFVPYTEHADEFKQEIKDIKLTHDNNVVFAHVGMSGAKSGKWTHKLGGNYSLEDLRYNEVDLVLMGHYHWRQNLSDNVLYTGDLTPLNFNDEGQSKGFYSVYFDEKNSKFDYKFMPVDSPKFETIDLDKLPDDFDLDSEINNNYVRLVTHSDDQTKSVRELIKSSEVDVAIQSKKQVEQKSRLDISAENSDSEIVKAYCKEYCPDLSELAIKYIVKAKESEG